MASRPSSSSGIRRSWAASCCDAGLATTTSTRCSRSSTIGFRARPTSSPIGTRSPERRSRPAEPGAPACWPPRASAEAPTAGCSSGSSETGDIFFARSDDPWILAGANVHISFIAQDDGSESDRELDGRSRCRDQRQPHDRHRSHRAQRLGENLGIAFMGDTKGGPFDIDAETARRSRARRIRWAIERRRRSALGQRPGYHRRPRDMWIIDFGADMTEQEAALYEAPFEFVRMSVRAQLSRSSVEAWWQHERPRPEMRSAIASLSRFIVTPTLAKHRLFVWADANTLPDHQLIVIARDDPYILGVLHSRAHAVGTSLGYPAGDPAAVHADDNVRDIPIPTSHGNAAPTSGGSRRAPLVPANRVAWDRARRPRANADEPLQQATAVAGSRPCIA